MKELRHLTFILLLSCLAVFFSCDSQPKHPDRLNVAIESNPTNLDPRIGNDVASDRVHTMVFNGLLKRERNQELSPDLAERWEQTDETTYIFYLRKDAKFHDGKPCTADDVVFTYTSLLAPDFQSVKKGGYAQIANVKAIDTHTVKFTLSEPYSPLLDNLTLGIVPKELNGKAPKDFAEHPIGTGPFTFTEWIQDEYVLLTKNHDYYGQKPAYKELFYKVVPDGNTRLLELRKGSVDLLYNSIPADALEEYEESTEFTVIKEVGVNYKYIGFNLEDPVLKNRQVRKALAHAVPRQKIVDYLLHGNARLAKGLLSPLNWAYTENVATYEFNPAKAKELLDEAGYPDPDGPEMRFKLTFKTSQDTQANKTAQVIQQSFKEIGVEMDIRSYEWATFYEDIRKGNFQIYSLKWVGVSDPDIYYSIFHSSSIPPNGSNRGRYINPDLDRLLEAGRQISDRAKRKQIYEQVQQIIAEDVPYISLWHDINIGIYRDRIKGFSLYPNGGFESLLNIKLVNHEGH